MELFAKIRRLVGQVPGVVEMTALIFCAIDDNSPSHVRFIGLASLAYLLFPIDLIPDFLVILFGLGALDDIAVLYGAYRLTSSYIKPIHREKARALFKPDD